jgi:hypothetical protein
MRCKRFQVRRYSCAAAWIESRNGQENGRNGDSLSMKMTHVAFSFASLHEENSRVRFAGADFLPFAPKNARQLRIYARAIFFARRICMNQVRRERKGSLNYNEEFAAEK